MFAAIVGCLLACTQAQEFSGKFMENGRRLESLRESSGSASKEADSSSHTISEWTDLCVAARSESTRAKIAATLARIATAHHSGNLQLSEAEAIDCRVSARKLMNLSTDTSAKTSACKIAKAFDDPECRRLLVLALTDKAFDVRQAAVAGLGQIGDNSTIEPLAKIVQREERTIQIAAINAIANIGINAKSSGNPTDEARSALERIERNPSLPRLHENARRGIDAIVIGKKIK